MPYPDGGVERNIRAIERRLNKIVVGDSSTCRLSLNSDRRREGKRRTKLLVDREHVARVRVDRFKLS